MNQVISENILLGCKKGDRSSQRALYELYCRKMMSVCLRYARHTDEAKDMLQEGFIKVFQSISKFDNKGSLEGWIRRIIFNCAIDLLRKEKRLVFANSENTLENELIAEEEEEQDLLNQNLSQEEILKMIGDLSPQYRTVFNLYVFENYTHQEIAQLLGISVGASKSNLAKARQNLKKAILKLMEVEK